MRSEQLWARRHRRHLRRDAAGDTVTYVVNRNVNFADVCYVGCRFCAFAQRRSDADASSLSPDEVANRTEEAEGLVATEACMPPPRSSTSGEVDADQT